MRINAKFNVFLVEIWFYKIHKVKTSTEWAARFRCDSFFIDHVIYITKNSFAGGNGGRDAGTAPLFFSKSVTTDGFYRPQINTD